mmetsp:Transcript_31100/g.99812  ORF Transcript_31100/g.99812 Transcript_31100/m.99812 type:complete len:418 (+) Transcript_31100:101-1354(+)
MFRFHPLQVSLVHDVRHPVYLFWVYRDSRTTTAGQPVFNQARVDIDDPLPLVVVEDLEAPESVLDVLALKGCAITELLYGDGPASRIRVVANLLENMKELASPMGLVAHTAKIGEGPLGRPFLLLDLRELEGEADDELAVSLSLVLRESEDAGKVVVHLAFFLLGEISHHMTSLIVTLADNIEEERVDIPIERLVVEEHLGEVAKVLAPHLRLGSVYFKHRNVISAVYLISRWVPRTFSLTELELMSLKLFLSLVEIESKLTEVEHVNRRIVLLPYFSWQGREVPSLNHEFAYLNLAHVLDLGHLLMLFQGGFIEPVVIVVPFVLPLIEPRVLLLPDLSQKLFGGVEVDAICIYPGIQPPVEIGPMYIVFISLDLKDLSFAPIIFFLPPESQDSVAHLHPLLVSVQRSLASQLGHWC